MGKNLPTDFPRAYQIHHGLFSSINPYMYHRVSLINSFLKCIRRVWTVHGDGDGDDRLRHAAREKAHSMGVMLFGNPYPAVTKSK